MNTIIIDTETSGFVRKFSPTDPDQARMLEVGCVIRDQDVNEIDQFSTLVKHGSICRVSTGAYEVHGLTWKQCESAVAPLINTAPISAARR